MNNTIIEELNGLIPKRVTLYESAVIAKNREALKEDILKRTKRQISIVMSNYQQALEEFLLSDVVLTDIYQVIITESNQILSEMASDIDEDMGNIKELFEELRLNSDHGSVVSSITDEYILQSITEIMPKYQAILNDCLGNKWGDFIETKSNYEENMATLDDELSNLTIPSSTLLTFY
ncbi:hypothetical protein [Enterococcus faecalis]|uniref:hypothetical protein n=1 Tax=Enterococcus faecalis TaxID=1351 RepID=UPI0021DF8D66|nr:hypothetical protein [Enterococcus faecalis]MCU9758061.1 hypothetical protein [Enterococcus faecalis]MCU9771568.1 hypothetical protein [Enterococcus faecalis]MCU9775322.1 hypothetical protein [Enterococcus faecalis]MCU9792568.1 hypothetical protein [Enterococcus faecalis]HDV0865304.1 hypothetical protein [Enterococcus faecalis]